VVGRVHAEESAPVDAAIHSNIFSALQPSDFAGEASSSGRDDAFADIGGADLHSTTAPGEHDVPEEPAAPVESAGVEEEPTDPFAILSSLGMQPAPRPAPEVPASGEARARTGATYPYSLIRPAGPAYAIRTSYTPASPAVPADDRPPAAEAAMPAMAESSASITSSSTEEPAGEDHNLAAAIAANEDYTPDIETIEVHEAPVALADDLDLSVPDYGAEAPRQPVYDDLDHEFEQAFQTLSHGTDAVRQAAVTPTPRSSFDIDEEINQLFRNGDADRNSHDDDAAVAAAGLTAAEIAAAHAKADALSFDHEDFLPDEYQGFPGDESGYAASARQEMQEILPPPYAMPLRHGRGGRGLLAAGLLAGVALLGGIGVVALYHGGAVGSDKPVVVKADNDPVKVKPKNPGGMNVPNQDNKVYERVADGVQEVAPEQKKLVSSEETPVDVASHVTNSATALPGVFEDATIDDRQAAANGDGSPAAVAPAKGAPKVAVVAANDAAGAAPAKSEDRVIPDNHDAAPAADSRPVAVAPHRVRTMIVRPDGTLVQREEEVPAASAPSGTQVASASKDAPIAALPAAAPIPSQPAEVKMASVQPASANETSVSPARSEPEAARPVATSVAAKPAVDDAVAGKPAEAAVRKPVEHRADGEIDTPARVALAPSRPADQPLDIVGAAKPARVASVETAPTVSPSASATANGWTVQIASQPTAEAAQTSYQNMARRYGNILGGHAVNIVKAEIAGKGTYYRVRMLASSKEDAIALCTKYKAAGGSCFVSR
jgi:hypothetical protein